MSQTTKKSASTRAKGAADDQPSAGFSDEELAAMRERSKELKAQSRRGRSKADGTADVLAKIADMPEPDRSMATRIHAIVTATAPDLTARLYYGQPAWARGGKVVVFFRSGQMDKERYSTFGVTTHATLDDDNGLWPTSYALADPTVQAWEELADIVRRATAQ